MGLLDDAKKPAAAAAVAEGTHEAAAPVEKKHSNSDYQKRQREKAKASADIIAKVIADNKIKLTAEQQDALDFLCRVKKPGTGNSGNFGTPVINKLFGENIAAGAKITAVEVFQKTGKGYAEMRQLMKKWAEKGIVVELDEATNTYTVKSVA